MAIETKSLQDSQANWTTVTPGRSQVYVTNSVARVGKWSANTIAGIPNFQAAVADAHVPTRIRTNVSGRGSQRYPAKIQSVGGGRFAGGVQAAGPDYASGFGPYLQVIQSVNLPGKGPRGDPRNYLRVQAVGDALHTARLRSSGAA